MELEDGGWDVVGVLYEVSFSHQEIEYLYREYLEERSARQGQCQLLTPSPHP